MQIGITFFSFRKTFRSRSSTPSSPPGTPPQSQQNDLLDSHFSNSLANSLATGNIKPDFPSSRTYSDQLRNFAAKYNALNEYELELHYFFYRSSKIHTYNSRPNNTKNSAYESELNMTSAKSGISKAPSSPENSKKSNVVPSIRSPVRYNYYYFHPFSLHHLLISIIKINFRYPFRQTA